MNAKNLFHRGLACLLLLAMVVGYLPAGLLQVKAEESSLLMEEEADSKSTSKSGNASVVGENESLVPTWPAVASHIKISNNPYGTEKLTVDSKSYTTTYMGAMTVLGKYAFFIRTDEERTSSSPDVSVLGKINLETHGASKVKDTAGNTISTLLGSPKSMDGFTAGGKNYLITTMNDGSNPMRLMRLNSAMTQLEAISTLTAVKSSDGTNVNCDRVTVLSVEGNDVTVLFRNGWTFYTATFRADAPPETITATHCFTLNHNDTRAMIRQVAGVPEYSGHDSNNVGVSNITSMDYYEDRLYVSAYVDCVSVVLVYSDVASHLAPNSTAPTLNSDLCIRSSGAGYESYKIQDLAVHQGVIYYVSRGRWFSSDTYRGDVCHFTNSSDDRYDIEESFRETGAYYLGGVDDPDYVIVNQNRSDGQLFIQHLTELSDPAAANAVKGSTTRDALFGLESDQQGYYYIRSLSRGYNLGDVKTSTLVTPYYITADPNGEDVTLAPKADDVNYQLWYFKYNGKNNGNKIYAIYNKATGRLLYNDQTKESDGTEINHITQYINSKNFVLRQQKVCADYRYPLESFLFDYEFYKAAYPDEVGNMTEAEAKEHYETKGKKNGYVASPFFDPVYYHAKHSDVKNHATYGTYQGAYTHFVNYGFWEGRQGSAYFCIADYYGRAESKDIRDLYSADKVLVLYHYKNYGVVNNATKGHRAGSDSLDLQELVEEYDLGSKFTTDSSDLNDITEYANAYSVLCDYVSSLIRLNNCTGDQAQLEELLFDPEVYKLDPALAENLVSKFTGDTYYEKLEDHWNKNGKTEGRVASYFLDPPYYASRYPDEVKSLEQAYEHFVTVGFEKGYVGSEYVSMAVDTDPCLHEQKAVAIISSCTENCSRVTFCGTCHFVLNRENSPALSHSYSSVGSKCTRCGTTITADVLKQNELLQLESPVPTNELVTSVSPVPTGKFYLVQKGEDSTYRIFNPLVQTSMGTMGATKVYTIGNGVLGTDPEMAVEIIASGSNHRIKIENDYYLASRSDSNTMVQDDIARSTTENDLSLLTISAHRGGTVTIRNDIDTDLKDTTAKVPYYLCLEKRLEMIHFEWSLVSTLSTSPKSSWTDDDVFYLYRVKEDLLHTEALYAALAEAIKYIPNSSLYEVEVYQKFLKVVDEAKALYEQYNGITLSADQLANKAGLQAGLKAKERELVDLMNILSINLKDDKGNTVEYFTATMYNWNEDNMNALVADLVKTENAGTKGFFFESALNKSSTVSSFSSYDSSTKETVNGISTNAQSYSIYSGLVASDLSKATNPPFHNSNVVAADYWSYEEIENAKEVYTNVQVPFIYDENGYYNLNSDTNGVFFEGEPTSGAKLAILDKPMAYYWYGGISSGLSVPGYRGPNAYGHRPENGYATGFQPFASVTNTVGRSYLSSTSVNKVNSTVDSYLMDGISMRSSTSPFPDFSGRGTATWGFGMKLSVDFHMTEDGLLNGDPDKPITFSFSGDDDVWVFIDGKLVMDIGGSHDAIQGKIDFSTGEVILRSQKYGRIRDKNPSGYGHGNDAAQYGSEITSIGSILTNEMKQNNIYEKVFDQRISDFAADGVHTLTVYYMDRGKGRTNCAISFNLPQSDILTVEKDIADTYEGVTDPTTGKAMAISAATMEYLSTLDFGFTLYDNDVYVARQKFYVYNENGALLGTRETDRFGHFTLKNGQKAEFRNLQFTGQSYHVIEDDLNSRWSEPRWSGDTNGTPISGRSGYISPIQSMSGGPYSVESIRFVCTNSYSYYPELIPETQYVVPDYGKPIDVMVIDNAVFKGLSEEVVRDGKIIDRVPPDAEELKNGVVSYGTYYSTSVISGRAIRLSPKKMLTEECRIYVQVQITLDDASVRNASIPVRIAPATIMYYESDFLVGMPYAKEVFSYNVVGTTDEKYQWTDVTSAGKDTLQDNGVPGDEVYNLVIDKEAIPSTAFFADFDGEGYADRYSVDALYKGYDYDAYHMDGDKKRATNWVINEINSDFAVIDPDAGTLSFTMNPSKTSAYVQTGSALVIRNSTLNLIPVENSFAQVRLKLKNFMPDGSGLEPQVRIYYYDSDSDRSDKLQFDYVRISEEHLNSDEFFTVRIPLSKQYEQEAYIDRVRVQLWYTKSMGEDKPGVFTLDYFYVGPEMGPKESVDSEYLYFGFDGTEGDALRYSAGIYSEDKLNYDSEDGTNWASSHAKKDSANESYHEIDNREGTISLEIEGQPISGASNCGPIFMLTSTGSKPYSGSDAIPDASPLRFDARNAEYFQIRFKLENCTLSDADTGKGFVILYNYIDASGTGKHASDIKYVDYFTDSEDYTTLRFAIPKNSKMKKEAVTITSIGLRFRGLMGKDGGGKITIDEIFIGTEEAMYCLDESSRNLFFDFNNTDEDHIRYSAESYGGYNYDDPDMRHWGMSYGGETTSGYGAEEGSSSTANRYEIDKGILSIAIPNKPFNEQTRIGTTAIATSKDDPKKPSGYYPWHENPERMPLNFPAKYAEYIQIRFRVQDCVAMDTGDPNVGVIFYCSEEDGRTDYKIYNSTSYTITDDYITLRFKTHNGSYGRLQDVETILGVGVAFRNIKSATADSTTSMVHIDYLYIGEMVEANPAASSLYYSFENTEADRDRYDSDTYGYLNADDEVTVRWWDNDGTHTPNNDDDGKTESFTIDNASGTGVIVALPGSTQLSTQYPDFYIDSSATGNIDNNPLDFKPEQAEIYQVRFKLEGFQIGKYIDSETGEEKTKSPYAKLVWEEAALHDERTLVTASEAVHYGSGDLDTGKWITVTCKIPEKARNAAAIECIRVYFGGLNCKPGVKGKITIDYIYVGPDDRPDQVYGYDSHYNNDTLYSDGHSRVVEGTGVKVNENSAAYTELSFNFKGTGFDLISRTGTKQATIRVEVTPVGSEKPIKTMTVNNKGQLELYQIPVVSVQGLTYGEYKVTLWVNKAVETLYEALNRGGEFHFDGVRIYDPMGVNDASYYKADREAYNFIKEIRNILLDKEHFENLSDATDETIEGAVFVDVNSSLVQPDGSLEHGSDQFTTVSVANYNHIGPKNEVYIAPGQAVAFNLKVSTNRYITSLDIGAKTIVSGNANLKIGILAKDKQGNYTIVTDESYIISSSTAQYREMDIANVQVKSESDSKYQPMYLVFFNTTAPGKPSTAANPNAQGVISLTDVKVAYNDNPSTSQQIPEDSVTDPEIKPTGKNPEEAPIQMLVDTDTLPATKYFMNAMAETPILEDGKTIYHSLNLASDISINYIVPKADLAGYDSFYLRCEIPEYVGNDYVSGSTVKIAPVDKGDYWYFVLDGLTAVNMTDEINARLIMSANGMQYCSEVDTYSIAKYAMTQLEKNNAPEKLKSLCANLLRYGAKTQVFKDYRPDSLADKDLSHEHKTLLTDLQTVSFGSNNELVEMLEGPKVNWMGKALVLDSKVTVRYILEIADPKVSAEDLSLRIRYTDVDGEEMEVIISECQPYGTKDGWYSFDFDRLPAAELRTALYATAYYGTTPVSHTLCYSADTYGKNSTGSLGDLCRAMLAYSDRAKAYFE